MVGMRLQFLLACLFALLSAADSSAQQSPRLLPDRFGGWIANEPVSSGAPSASGGSPFDLSGPGGTRRVLQDSLYRETGAKWEEIRTYTEGKGTISVYAAKLRDPSSAYEL